MYQLELDENLVWSVNKCEGPDNCGSFNGSVAILADGEIIITSDQNIFLYSERMVQIPKCDLPENFGLCSLRSTDKNRNTYDCSTPSCNRTIHVTCDKSIRGKSIGQKLCPTCSNLDPKTWKKNKKIHLHNRK